jgi:Skp family chaperone for outer membrane proteins
MTISNKRKFIKASILLIAFLAVVTAVGYYFYLQVEEVRNKNNNQPETFGVIDYEVLIKEHPSYNELLDLERKIMSINQEPIDPEEMEKIGSDLGRKMTEYQQQLETMLEKERSQIFEETTEKIKELQEKLAKEYEKKKQELIDYRDKIEKEYGTGDSQKPLTEFEKRYSAKMQTKTRDLLVLKERQVAARRLELLKKSQEKLLAKKEAVETKTIEFEEKLRAQNQNMKLELQLKLQIARTDEDREVIQKQIEALYSEEQNKVDEFRTVLIDEFMKLESEELAKNEEILKKFEVKVDADVEKQVDKIKKEVADELVKEGLLSLEDDSFIPKEIKEKLDARQKQVEDEMKKLQEEVNRQVAQLEKQGQEEFERRKNQILEKLESYQSGLAKEFDRKRDELIREMESANKEQSKVRRDLLEKRQNLTNRMIEEIKEKVQVIAREKQIDIVLGMSEAIINAVDLTEESKSVVRTIQTHRTSTDQGVEEQDDKIQEKQ